MPHMRTPDNVAATHPLQTYLALLAETGIVGLALFIAAVGLPLAHAIKWIRSPHPDERQRLHILCLICSIITLLVFGLFHSMWMSPGLYSLFFGILCSLILAMDQCDLNEACTES